MEAPEFETTSEATPAPTPPRGPASRLVDQLKDRSSHLTDMGLAKAAEIAEAKKEGVVEKLDAASGIARDLAEAAGERFGAPVGGVVERGVSALDRVSQGLQSHSVEDLVGTARNAIVRYPGLALAAVSVVGFLAGRIVKAGLSQSAGRGSSGGRVTGAEAAA